jgi:hypothetical protein
MSGYRAGLQYLYLNQVVLVRAKVDAETAEKHLKSLRGTFQASIAEASGIAHRTRFAVLACRPLKGCCRRD